MAHFAELDENNVVTRIIVVSNDDLLDENGVEQESLGIAVCHSIFGPNTTWVQTSYNSTFRKNYAGEGYVYVPTADVFYNPVGPFPSWTLDENYDWQPPIPKPDGLFAWDEERLEWVPVSLEDDSSPN